MRIAGVITALLLLSCCTPLHAQNFTPIPVTGFNHDVFAESFPNTTTCTDTALDATLHIMYTQAFAAAAGLNGGLVDDGFIVNNSTNHQFQLAPYTASNALTLMRNVTRSLTLNTPESYYKLSLLCFSTEGASTINVSVKFTDGSITNYLTNYTLADWFYSTTNIMTNGFGRCQRMPSAPYNQDGYPSNPQLYYLDFNLNCDDQQKQVQSVILTNTTTTGFNAPFPNAVFLALSGMVYSEQVNASKVDATCSSANGSASLVITGTTGPYSVAWNTTPVQTGLTATNLTAGNYMATVTDINNCPWLVYVTILPVGSNISASATANPSSVCSGASSQLTVSATGGTLSTYTWTPGNLSGSTVTVNPTSTTTYTVSGQDQFGCNYTANVTVNMSAPPPAPTAITATVCSGQTASLSVQSPQPGIVYSWYTAASGGNPVATGNSYQTPALTSNTTYYLDAAAGLCISSRSPVTVTVNALPAPPTINGASICPGSATTLNVQNPQAGFTYNWYTNASGGTILNTATSYNTPTLSTNTTYYVEAVSTGGCSSSTKTPVTVSMVQQLAKPVVSVSGISSSSLTFSWPPVTGAAGYEVSIDGGATFTPPSSGANGTTHTITGLIQGQSISIQVRALGAQSCERSQWSDVVKGFVPDKNLFVPNVFTPNGDGRNDVLLVFSNSIASMQFRIFNQWGQQIFESNVPSKGWDGNYNGKPQPVGVYVYTLKVTLTDGTVITRKGSISLIR